MGAPQDWAPYSSVDEAAKVYLRDPELALDQLRSVVDIPAIRSFIMSRGFSEGSWGKPTTTRPPALRAGGAPSGRRSLTTEYEAFDDGTRRLSEVRLRMYTQLITRSRHKSITETDIYCESFRYYKSVDNGGLAQMQRLLQFGRVLSHCME
jgi:hypothetical protein